MIAIDLDDLPFQVAIVSRSRVSLRNWLPRPLKKMLYTKGTCKSSTFSKTPTVSKSIYIYNNIYIIIIIYILYIIYISQNRGCSVICSVSKSEGRQKKKQHKRSISKLSNIESISKEIYSIRNFPRWSPATFAVVTSPGSALTCQGSQAWASRDSRVFGHYH